MPSHNKLNTEQFINKASKIHNNFYDYSLVIYENNTSKIKIICPEHGEFKQTPKNHLRGCGCKECGKIKCANSRKITTLEFIERSKIAHNNKYDYSNIVINGLRDKIKFTCPIHGEFSQSPEKHIKGYGCKKCTIIDNPYFSKKSTEYFIYKSKESHGCTYDYTNSKYEGSKELISIKCKKHGEFKQYAGVHMRGHGCPSCSQSKGEKEISKILKSIGIYFERQKTFTDCLNHTTGRKLKFDFYIPSENLLIEYDGLQHFEVVNFFGGAEGFEYRKKLDKTKNRYANDNGFKLLRIPFYEKENISKIIQQNFA